MYETRQALLKDSGEMKERNIIFQQQQAVSMEKLLKRETDLYGKENGVSEREKQVHNVEETIAIRTHNKVVLFTNELLQSYSHREESISSEEKKVHEKQCKLDTIQNKLNIDLKRYEENEMHLKVRYYNII